MKQLPRLSSLSLICLITIFFFETPSANATWITGRAGSSEVALIDPLINVGPGTSTISTGQLSNTQLGFFSEADLGNGALRGSAFISAGIGFAIASPELGETIIVESNDGSDTWDYSYNVDGIISTTGNLVEQLTIGGNVFDRYFTRIELYIFRGGTVGSTNSPNYWANALNGPNWISSQTDKFTPAILDDITEMTLNGSINGSIALNAGLNAFDVVMLMSIGGNISDRDFIDGEASPSFDFDFTNTAEFEITSNQSFTSASGVFLTGVNRIGAVPEPGTLALFGLGLAGLGFVRRKKS